VAIWRTSVSPTPLPCRLVVKKRHEYLLALIQRNAGTVVGDCNGHTVIRVTLGGQNDPSLCRVAQGLDRISDQVNEGLIEQFDVGPDRERLWCNARRQLNVTGR